MRADDLMTHAPSPEDVAKETRKLPEPSAEAREELRRTLEASARPTANTPWPALLQEARGKMDSRYAGPVTSHRGGLSGPALVLAKRAFRLVFQPFINEALRKQVEFNESILDALATIHDVQREHARTQATWRQDVERRLTRIEEAARGLDVREGASIGYGRPPPETSPMPSMQGTQSRPRAVKRGGKLAASAPKTRPPASTRDVAPLPTKDGASPAASDRPGRSPGGPSRRRRR